MTPAEMAALHAACFTSPRPWAESEFSDLLATPRCFVLSQPGGMLLGQVVAGEAELLTLAVAPEQRRRGLGADLVRAFLREAARRGAESAFLEVAEANTPARALYAAAGFTPAGKRRGYYTAPDGSAQDALILVRSLIEP
ncbi:MAG: GNAT family N-acetyltransferase [Pseudorhodobacter sp.]|nr:MAG: GNAT family N-acetyltransferase [Pseudorhodobacter sp.]